MFLQRSVVFEFFVFYSTEQQICEYIGSNVHLPSETNVQPVSETNVQALSVWNVQVVIPKNRYNLL